MWLARELTQAAGVSREVGSFDAAGGVANCEWPEDCPRRRGPRGRRLRCRWVTWPAVSGLRTVAGGGRLLRGSDFNSTVMYPRGLAQAAGACSERAASTVDGDVATWADQAAVLRGRWRHWRWRGGRRWLAK